MKLYWIRVSSKLSEGVLMKQRNMDTHTRKRHINLEAGIEVLLPQAKEYKAPLEAGRCKGTISYSAFRDTLTLSSS